MPNTLSPNELDELARRCPATFGREAIEHSWITVTRSTSRPVPYTMCSKCGVTRTQAQGASK